MEKKAPSDVAYLTIEYKFDPDQTTEVVLPHCEFKRGGNPNEQVLAFLRDAGHLPEASVQVAITPWKPEKLGGDWHWELAHGFPTVDLLLDECGGGKNIKKIYAFCETMWPAEETLVYNAAKKRCETHDTAFCFECDRRMPIRGRNNNCRKCNTVLLCVRCNCHMGEDEMGEDYCGMCLYEIEGH